jgi:hypothetical protein
MAMRKVPDTFFSPFAYHLDDDAALRAARMISSTGC